MSRLFIDIETRSELDVSKVGAFAYAQHPSTEILCMALGGDSGAVTYVTERQNPPPPELTTLVAHNVDFEREVLAVKWGWDRAAYEWIDTAALAARMGLPRSLEDLGAFFGFEKDMAGNRVMRKLCAPRRPSRDNPAKWWTPESKPEDFERLYAYCRQDVEVMRAIFPKLLPLDEQEARVHALTERMNARGVALDLPSIPAAQKVIDLASRDLAARFRTLTGCPVKSYAKVAQALGMADVRKPTVRKALRDPRTRPEHAEALRIYQTLARSSTAKLDAMARRVSGDGRLRGAMVYAGAERTARWSSMGVQLQNFPRGLGGSTDIAFDALRQGVIPELYDDPVGTVAEMLRGFLVGPFLVGDLAQIEARMLAWLAGERELLQLFRDGKDPYCHMASRIYNRTITKKDKDERFMGKQLVLGAGYGLGARGFRRLLDETYDVDIPEAEAKRLVQVYRRTNPAVTRFWDLLHRGWMFATENKSKRIKVGPVFMGTFTHGGEPYTFIELPSGRRMLYARPHMKGTELRYFGRDIKQGGMWTTVKTYGGKLAENVTQAASRDVLAEAMLRMEDRGYVIVATVHDEVVADASQGTKEEFHELLVQVPTWAEGLPIEAEVFKSQRYRK